MNPFQVQRLPSRTTREERQYELNDKREYFLNGSLVDTTAFVDEMSSGSRLAGIDVADNDTKKKNESEHVQE
jgi:hypothetical protein